MKRRRIILAILIGTLLCAGCGGQDVYKGLVLKAAPDVTVSLSSEFKDGVPIAPEKVVEAEDGKYYYYPDLAGAYRCQVTGVGYYALTQSISVTGESAAVDVTPGKIANAGWEPQKVRTYTDQLLTGLLSDDLSQWPAYEEVFTTPYFTQEHADHQMTTQAQLEAFLKELDSTDERMHVYSMGTSGLFGHDIPIVIFTQADLSGAENFEQAAKAMGQDKPTVFIRSQMHGNEPAAGEAALGMIAWLHGSLGDQVLDKLNVCIVPRQNPDGAQEWIRTVGGSIDPNRDNLRLQSQEITAYAQACQWLEPEVIIDGHEYTVKSQENTVPAGDVLVQMGYITENTQPFQTLNKELVRAIFDGAAKNGIAYRYYSNCANSLSTNISGAYAAKQGTLYILLETPGINGGLYSYARRIMGHVSSMEAVLRYVAENPTAVQGAVDAQRQTIIDRGAKYDPENVVPLAVESEENASLQYQARSIDQVTGAVKENVQTPITYSVVTRSRVAPTAYVIPAGETFAQTVLELMDKHAIAYTFIPKGSTVQLQQYCDNGDIYLTDETAVTFPNGAYVFCKNQVRGLLLSMLMEPDVDAVAKQSGTLVQQSIISATDGKLPLYRYIRDLNAAGFIDYH